MLIEKENEMTKFEKFMEENALFYAAIFVGIALGMSISNLFIIFGK